MVEPNAGEGIDPLVPDDSQGQAPDTQLPTVLESEPTPGQSAPSMMPFVLTGVVVFALVGGYAGMRIGRRRKGEAS